MAFSITKVTALVTSAVVALVSLGGVQAPKEPKDTKTPKDAAASEKWKSVSFYTFKTKTLDNKDCDFKQYEGKVALVVNVASACGLTPQYAGLETLYGDLKDKGLVVLGFPCNDFGDQEPGTAEEIRSFCTNTYKVTFPLFAKLQTKAGEGQSELYSYLAARTNSLPTWNFGKYLIGRDGQPIAYFGPKTKPDDKDLRAAIDKALAASATPTK